MSAGKDKDDMDVLDMGEGGCLKYWSVRDSGEGYKLRRL